jgi:hypothetical protein
MAAAAQYQLQRGFGPLIISGGDEVGYEMFSEVEDRFQLAVTNSAGCSGYQLCLLGNS